MKQYIIGIYILMLVSCGLLEAHDDRLYPRHTVQNSVNYTLVHDDGGNLIKVELWIESISVPIIDGIPWWPDACVSKMHGCVDVKDYQQKNSYIVTPDTAPPKAESWQIQKPDFTSTPMPPKPNYVPPQHYGVPILGAGEQPKEPGMYCRVSTNTGSLNSSCISNMSNQQFQEWYIGMLIAHKYCRLHFQMTLAQKNDLMSSIRYTSFQEKLLDHIALSDISDKAVWDLVEEFAQSKKWQFGDGYHDCVEAIQQSLQERKERKDEKERQRLEVIAQQKLIELKQQEDDRLFAQLMQEQAQAARQHLEAMYEEALYGNRYHQQSRAQAFQKSKEEGFAQYDATYTLSAQTRAYLAHLNFDPAQYGLVHGTSFQHELHKEICSVFDQAAQLHGALPYQSKLLEHGVVFADAAHDVSKAEMIQLAIALTDASFQFLDTVRSFAGAALRGVYHGTISSMKSRINPFESIDFLAKAVCYVFETAAITGCAEDFGFDDLFVGLRDRRNQEIGQALTCLGTKILQASGPDIVEELVSFGMSFRVPGKLLKGLGSVVTTTRSVAQSSSAVETVAAVAGKVAPAKTGLEKFGNILQKSEQIVADKAVQKAAHIMEQAQKNGWRTTKKLKHPKKAARAALEGATGKPTEPRTCQDRMDSALRDARTNPKVKTRLLPDERVRYYYPEKPSDTIGPTRGRSTVVEHNPKKNGVRVWMECYDHNSRVNRVHPKMINGITVISQHYPATYKDTLDNIKGLKWLTRGKSSR